jgi:hypothetical protein
MEKILLISIIAGLIMLGSTFFLFMDPFEDELKSDSKNGDSSSDQSNTPDISSENNLDNLGSSSSGGDSGSGSGGSGSSESSTSSTQSSSSGGINPPPSDAGQKPCGFYFAEYEFCGGVCSNGVCTSDGKSCYCKT